MNDLHKAYQVLGLDPGTSLDALKRRYKRLAIVWHPDRMPNDAGKREAEEELKEINDAWDRLKNHFEKHHREDSGCGCQPPEASTRGYRQSNTDSQSANGRSDKTKQQQERDAQHKQERRQTEDPPPQTGPHKRQEQNRTDGAATHGSTRGAQQEQGLRDERLRWKATQAIGAAFVVVLCFGWVGLAVKEFAVNIEHQWSTVLRSVFPVQPTPPSSGQ